MKLSPRYQDLLKDFGINLNESFGVAETALPLHAAKFAVEALCEDGFAIAGGDVYCRDNGVVKTTRENWHCNPRSGESVSDYVERSCECALAFVREFKACDSAEPLFVLVALEYFGYGVFGNSP